MFYITIICFDILYVERDFSFWEFSLNIFFWIPFLKSVSKSRHIYHSQKMQIIWIPRKRQRWEFSIWFKKRKMWIMMISHNCEFSEKNSGFVEIISIGTGWKCEEGIPLVKRLLSFLVFRVDKWNKVSCPKEIPDCRQQMPKWNIKNIKIWKFR